MHTLASFPLSSSLHTTRNNLSTFFTVNTYFCLHCRFVTFVTGTCSSTKPGAVFLKTKHRSNESVGYYFRVWTTGVLCPKEGDTHCTMMPYNAPPPMLQIASSSLSSHEHRHAYPQMVVEVPINPYQRVQQIIQGE